MLMIGRGTGNLLQETKIQVLFAKKTLTTFCYQRFQGKKNGVRSRTRTYDLHDVNVAL